MTKRCFLDCAAMQAIAAWPNLSETTLVLPPTQAGADYRLRVLTPRQELPCAGHPSLRGTRFGALPPAVIDNGPRWWCIELADEPAGDVWSGGQTQTVVAGELHW
jgi:PhzF family phenazine biosynthesis protein